MTAEYLTLDTLAPVVGREIRKAYGDRLVLDGVDLTAPPGRVVAVVGENGAGKSTLLRLLAGAEEPDGGSIRRPRDVGYLGQRLTVPAGATVAWVLADALAQLHHAVTRLETLAGRLEDAAAAEEYAALLEWAVRHDAWDADRRAGEAAARLGLGELDPSRPVATLSGGQSSRLALAALLTRRPACLLLDEPTNHLDDLGAEFLERTLRELPGVAVVASHDRVFLESVADTVLDLDAGHFGSDGRGGRSYGTGRGRGYSDFLAARSLSRLRWEQAYVEHQREVDRLRTAAASTARQVAHDRPPRDGDKFIYHFKGSNVERTVSRRVRDAERRLAALEDQPVPRPPAPLTFTGRLTGARAGAVRIRGLHLPHRVRVEHLDVLPGERLLVTGANGSGKSTLLGAVAGRLAPEEQAAVAGAVTVHSAGVGYLPQDVRFGSPRDPAAAVFAAATGSPVRLAELGLLHPRDLHRPVGVLSLGQQRRLALAVLVARSHDLVLLDEPTNHISLALAEELEAALQRSLGTVVVATHDRWLRRRWEGPRVELSPCA